MEREQFGERRRYRRFRVQQRAFVVFGSHITQLGALMDISRGGLGIRYIACGDHSNASAELDIYLAGKSFYLGKVPFETIWDAEIPNLSPSTSITTRRRGVQFGELTQDQVGQLRYFIRNHTRPLDTRPPPANRLKAYGLNHFSMGGIGRKSGKQAGHND